MLWRERRKTNGALELSVSVPVNASSRALADSEIQRLSQSVIPIVGTNSNRQPYLVGSAVLLVHKGRKVLVTAAHVLGDNRHVPLAFFGASGWSRPLFGAFLESDKDDIAATLLSDTDIQALHHRSFLVEDSIARSEPGRRFYASVVGYPATAAKLREANALDTPLEAYFQFGTERADGSVTVAFNKKEGASAQGEHVNVRDPIGKSGGAIFALDVRGNDVLPNQQATLVGIPTRWRRADKMIQGTGVARLVPLLEELVAR